MARTCGLRNHLLDKLIGRYTICVFVFMSELQRIFKILENINEFFGLVQ